MPEALCAAWLPGSSSSSPRAWGLSAPLPCSTAIPFWGHRLDPSLGRTKQGQAAVPVSGPEVFVSQTFPMTCRSWALGLAAVLGTHGRW